MDIKKELIKFGNIVALISLFSQVFPPFFPGPQRLGTAAMASSADREETSSRRPTAYEIFLGSQESQGEDEEIGEEGEGEEEGGREELADEEVELGLAYAEEAMKEIAESEAEAKEGRGGSDKKKKESYEERVVKRLIKASYPWRNDKELESLYYVWTRRWLIVLTKAQRMQFLSFEPNLREWEPVFRWGTPKENINFNFLFLENNHFVLSPKFWAGLSYQSTLLNYYVFTTKNYIIYVEKEDIFLRYNGKNWKVEPEGAIMTQVYAWAASLRLGGAERAIWVSGDKNLLETFKVKYAIWKWPFVMGKNHVNGFFTIKDGLYTLLPHHPAHWARDLVLLPVPEEIVTTLDEKGMRFFLDLAGEDRTNANLLKLMFNLAVGDGSQNLLINLSGNPSGGKTILTNFLEEMLGPMYKAASVSALNTFHRKDLVINAMVIFFTDCNPMHLKPEGIDVLKSMTGNDPMYVETKNEPGFRARCTALVLITNNESFDAVEAYKEPAMYQWVLNIAIPSVKGASKVDDLARKLDKQTAAAFLSFGSTMNPAILKKSQRAADFNAVTGSGIDKVYFKFLIKECVYQEGMKTKGQDMHTAYVHFFKKLFPKGKPDALITFYRQLSQALDSVEPWTGFVMKVREGQAVFNVRLGKPEENSKIAFQSFSFRGAQDVVDLLSDNSLRMDAISFKDQDGNYVTGPNLDPKFNREMFRLFEAVKETTLKNLLEEGGKKRIASHIEEPQYKGTTSLLDLTEEDFRTEKVTYQEKLFYTDNPRLRLTDEAEFLDPIIKEALEGEKSPLVVHPKWAGLTAQGREIFHPDLKSILTFDYATKVFASDFRQIEGRVELELEEQAKLEKAAPLNLLDWLKVYEPAPKQLNPGQPDTEGDQPADDRTFEAQARVIEPSEKVRIGPATKQADEQTLQVTRERQFITETVDIGDSQPTPRKRKRGRPPLTADQKAAWKGKKAKKDVQPKAAPGKAPPKGDGTDAFSSYFQE